LSLVSATTGSDSVTLTVSGSGFNYSGSSANPDTNFNGRIFPVAWRSVDQPWINYGGFLDGNLILDPGNAGFKNNIFLPKGMIPSGQYDLIVNLPNQTAPLALRFNVSGSVAIRTASTAGPTPLTNQYQDVIPAYPFGAAIAPGGNIGNIGGLSGTPEFGYASGSVVG